MGLGDWQEAYSMVLSALLGVFCLRFDRHAAAAAAAAKLLQSCPTLCDPIDGSPPGSLVPGILQARTLEWVAISFSKCMKVKSESEVAQSCLTLSHPMDCSPVLPFVHFNAFLFSSLTFSQSFSLCLWMHSSKRLESPSHPNSESSLYSSFSSC